MAAIGIGIGAATAAVGALTGRTLYEELNIAAREARTVNVNSRAGVEELAQLVADEEAYLAALHGALDELLG